MRHMKRNIVLALVIGTVAAVATAAIAVSNAHFVGTPTLTQNADNTLTVSGKVAGLGDVEEITVAITGDALCINPGQKHPKAANKAAVSGGATIPVQNGKANFDVTTNPVVFQPDCSPPMTVAFANIVVRVTAADGTNLVFRF